MEGSAEIFPENGSSRADDFQRREAELYQQVGKLQMPLFFMKRGEVAKKGLPASTERLWINQFSPQRGEISLFWY